MSSTTQIIENFSDYLLQQMLILIDIYKKNKFSAASEIILKNIHFTNLFKDNKDVYLPKKRFFQTVDDYLQSIYILRDSKDETLMYINDLINYLQDHIAYHFITLDRFENELIGLLNYDRPHYIKYKICKLLADIHVEPLKDQNEIPLKDSINDTDTLNEIIDVLSDNCSRMYSAKEIKKSIRYILDLLKNI